MNMITKPVMMAALAVYALMTNGARISPELDHAMINGAKTMIQLSVVDENGLAVPNAQIHVVMGMNFRDKAYFIDGVANSNGMFVVEGKTTGNEIKIEVSKLGYYKAVKKMCYVKMGKEHTVRDGKWMPWGEKETLMLREVKSPVDMVMGLNAYMVPATNIWIGFDMKAGNWVKPYSKGVIADFEVKMEWDGKPPAKSNFSSLDIRFQDVDAGAYYVDKIKGSAFNGVYSADANAVFGKHFNFKTIWDGGMDQSIKFDNSKIMVVRSRCIHDSHGHLVSAHYAFIKGINVMGTWEGKGEMTINYGFNPTSNDVRLEPKVK